MECMKKAVAGVKPGDREGMQMVQRDEYWRQTAAAQGGDAHNLPRSSTDLPAAWA